MSVKHLILNGKYGYFGIIKAVDLFSCEYLLMISDKDRIRELERLLAEQKRRADKAEQQAAKAEDKALQAESKRIAAEEKAKVAESKATALEAEVAEYRKIKPLIQAARKVYADLLADVTSGVLKHCNDIPEGVFDQLSKAFVKVHEEFVRCPQHRLIARLFKTSQSEGVDAKALKKKTDLAEKEIREAHRSIKKRQQLLGDAFRTCGEAAEQLVEKSAGQSSVMVCAAAAIQAVPDPEQPEFAPLPHKGKQAVEAFQNAPVQETDALAHCPHCGSDHLTQGTEYAQSLRKLSVRLDSLADLIAQNAHHVYCEHCGTVSLVTGGEVPVAPGRTIGQSLAVTAGIMNATGLSTHRVQQVLENADDQLGNDTLGRNAHDWAMAFGKPLMALAQRELDSQTVRMVDETPMTILQSQARGICKPAPENEQRQKDYLLAQTSGPHEKHRVCLFSWIGGRSREAIGAQMQGMQNKVLVSDGYRAYVELSKGMQHQSCCAHLRRYLLDAIDEKAIDRHLFANDPEKAVARAMEQLEKGTAPFMLCVVLKAMTKIYGYEKSLRREAQETEQAFLDRILQCRQTYAKPLMGHVDTIMSELAKTYCRCKANGEYEAAGHPSLVAQAVVYYMNRRESFQVFLSDPRVPPDNNSTELAIRTIAVLRKVTNFKQSQERTQSLCILMSLNEMAKANGITDTVRWLHAYGRALYLHRASRTLTAKKNAGENWQARLTKFDEGSDEGFDYSAWLPWNYREPEGQTE